MTLSKKSAYCKALFKILEENNKMDFLKKIFGLQYFTKAEIEILLMKTLADFFWLIGIIVLIYSISHF